MKSRTIAVLAGLFFLALLALVLLERARSPRTPEEARLLFPGFDTAAVSNIRIGTRQRSVSLERKAGLWTVAPEGFPADEMAIEDLLGKVAEMKRADIASTNPEKAAKFEVDEGGERTVEVLIRGGEQELARFYVGKQGPDFSSNYVRLEGSDEVTRTTERIREAFDRGDRTWRERRIFDFPKEDVVRLELTSPEVNATLEATGEGEERSWAILTGEESWPADASKVDGIARTLATLHTDDFAPADIDLATTGLEEPERRAVITLVGDVTHELQMGAETEENRVYARSSADDTVYLVGKYRIGQIFRELDQFKAEPPPEPPEDAEPDTAPDAAPATGN